MSQSNYNFFSYMSKKLTGKQTNDGENHLSSAAMNRGARPSGAVDVKKQHKLRKLEISESLIQEEYWGAHTSNALIRFIHKGGLLVSGPNGLSIICF